jgi:hypothetical protein
VERVVVIYDVLLQSLARSYKRHVTLWVRGIEAASLTDACERAKNAHPDLGLTPTTVSAAWYVWPQPKRKLP